MAQLRVAAPLRSLLLLLVAAFVIVSSTWRSMITTGRDRAGVRSTAIAGAQSTTLHEAAWPLRGTADDYDPLMQLIGDAQFVLLGEATHGTHEFYRERARITQRLIQEKGFTVVAIEGDWPDAERVNQYLQGISSDQHAEQALSSFTRFPQWMWNNVEMRDFVQWLKTHNDQLPSNRTPVGFYGLDLYSFLRSADDVVQHLRQIDSQAAERAHERYLCFRQFPDDALDYGRAASRSQDASCEGPVRDQLQELQTRASRTSLLLSLNLTKEQHLFSALQNARVVKNAEEYYRTLYDGDTSSWNLRDRHMADTLDALSTHFGTSGEPAKVVAWAHNTHMGDASATELGESGDWSIGQLMRERHPGNTVLVGFTTYTGTVMAASEWEQPGELKQVRPALPESYDALFHNTNLGNFLLLPANDELVELSEPRLERAIGVIYLPQTERFSHYFQARLAQQFDAVIHWDVTQAVQLLEP